jgi:hypothetical protein
MVDFAFTYVLERSSIKSHRVAIPDFINQDPSIDSNVWSKKKKRLELVVRLTEDKRQTLNNYWKDTFSISDGIYDYVVWMLEADHEWDSTNSDYPWKSTISFIVISQGLMCGCPSGEQMGENRGFELGDFTGWTVEGSPTISDYLPRSGTYCALLYQGDKISQTFADGIKVACISAFKLYTRGSGCSTPDINVKIYYKDGSDETYVGSVGWGSYKEHDITSSLDAGKCVTKIEIWMTDSGYSNCRVDDVTLVATG